MVCEWKTWYINKLDNIIGLKVSYLTLKGVILRCCFHDSRQQLFKRLERNVCSRTLLFSSTSDDERSSSLNISQHRVQSVSSHPGIATHRNTIAPNPVSLHWSIPHCTYDHFHEPSSCRVRLNPVRQILVFNVHSIKIHTLFKEKRKKTYTTHWVTKNTDYLSI